MKLNYIASLVNPGKRGVEWSGGTGAGHVAGPSQGQVVHVRATAAGHDMCVAILV